MTIGVILMFVSLMVLLLLGYPVAFTLGSVALLFGSIFLGTSFFNLLPLQIWGIMNNFTLLAVPLFIFMGVALDKSGLAEDLLETMGLLFGKVRGGLAVSVVLVGALLAATTGVVGATVVTMGIIALPTMLKRHYSPQLASGTIAAAGTLGQIIPPSIILIFLGAGGAVRGILDPIFDQHPSQVVIANRTLVKAEQLKDIFSDRGSIKVCNYDELSGINFDLIINGTSASLKNEVPPLPNDLSVADACCYDMMYSNKDTAFVTWAKQHHAAKAVDGLGMLVEQAAESFYIWRGIKPDTQAVIKEFRNQL